MSTEDWPADTRSSYDAVAAGYAALVGPWPAGDPHDPAVLEPFAELVRTGRGGPVADVGCGPGHVRPTSATSAWTPRASTCHRP